MHQQFRHVDDVRRLYRQDHQKLLVRRQHLHSVCDKENLNLVHQLLAFLDVNQMLVRQLLDVLVVDVQQNLDELILDADLTLVDVRLDVVVVVLEDVALRLHLNRMDCFQREVDVALMELQMQRVLPELQELLGQQELLVQQVFQF
jgi:DNA-binding ferritin-like protein (Dps family)